MEIAKVEYLHNGDTVTVIGRIEIIKSNHPRKRVSHLIPLRGEYSPILVNEGIKVLEKIRVEYSSPIRATKIQMGVHNGGYQVVYINNFLPKNRNVIVARSQVGNGSVVETRSIQTELCSSKEEALKEFFDMIGDLNIETELFNLIQD